MDIQPPDGAAWRFDYDEVVDSLRAGLPRPAGVWRGQTKAEFDDAYTRRDRAAFDIVVALEPADNAEASLAVHFAINAEHLAYVLRAARVLPATEQGASRWFTAADMFFKLTQETRSMLWARQEARRKREAAREARKAAARPRRAKRTGGGLVARGGVGAAPRLLPPLPQGDAQGAAVPRARPVLRVIRGGRAE